MEGEQLPTLSDDTVDWRARATMVDDKISLDRTKELFSQGVSSKQAQDDATAKYEASQQRVNSLEQSYKLSKIGPRVEQIEQARGSLTQARGQLASSTTPTPSAHLSPSSVTSVIIWATVGNLLLHSITFDTGAGGQGAPEPLSLGHCHWAGRNFLRSASSRQL
jgi:RNA polymerase-binding transcription factor DksA